MKKNSPTIQSYSRGVIKSAKAYISLFNGDWSEKTGLVEGFTEKGIEGTKV